VRRTRSVQTFRPIPPGSPSFPSLPGIPLINTHTHTHIHKWHYNMIFDHLQKLREIERYTYRLSWISKWTRRAYTPLFSLR